MNTICIKLIAIMAGHATCRSAIDTGLLGYATDNAKYKV